LELQKQKLVEKNTKVIDIYHKIPGAIYFFDYPGGIFLRTLDALVLRTRNLRTRKARFPSLGITGIKSQTFELV
jgi:hypothetical protein